MRMGIHLTSHTIVFRHYNDVTMSAIASQTTSLTIVYSTVYSDAHQRKDQSSASLAFVRWIHRRPVNSAHKEPVTRKMFPFDYVIMVLLVCCQCRLVTCCIVSVRVPFVLDPCLFVNGHHIKSFEFCLWAKTNTNLTYFSKIRLHS